MDPLISSDGKLGLVAKLKSEGFDFVYEQEDEPNVAYDAHAHPTRTAHIVLRGWIEITADGTAHRLAVGDRFDVPAGAMHSARVGPEGCSYLVGE